MIRKAEPLYGAPTGNRVMKSKRVHGDSAYRILSLHVLHEHCHVKGCKLPVCVTRHPDMGTRHRACIEHVAQGAKSSKPVTDLLKFGWE